MPTAGPQVGAALQGMLQAKDIAFHPGRKVVRIDAKAKTVAFEDGTLAAFGSGNFYGDTPQMRLYEPSPAWHWGKVLFEKWWLAPFGARRGALGLMMRLGGRMKGLRVRL